jgi:hypothetical protein
MYTLLYRLIYSIGLAIRTLSMRSLVSVSLLSIGIISNPLQLHNTQTISDLQKSNISTSEYSIVFADVEEKPNLLGSTNSNLKSELKKVNEAELEKYRKEILNIEKKKEEDRLAAEQKSREESARKQEEERQAQLAKEQAQAVAAQEVKTSNYTPPAPRVITGDKTNWMRDAGIPEDQWQYVDYIVTRESTWNPNALNPSSGACGLAQASPCSKIQGDWRDPVVSLKWQFNYVNSRYGGYKQAYDFWRVNNWY